MRVLLASCLLLLLAAAPPHPSLTADDEARLGNREVVIDFVETDAGDQAVGVVDVAAPLGVVFHGVLDLESRRPDTGSVERVSYYRREPDTIGARWELSVLGAAIVFHTLYRPDRGAGFIPYALDTSRDNDLVAAFGSYHLYAHGDRTRLVYRSFSDSGRPLPGFVKRRMASSSLAAQLVGIRDRAEAAAR